MPLPWNSELDRASPRQALIRWLAGPDTVVLNAHFGVVQVEDGFLATLENAEDGSTLVEATRGLGIPGHGRLSG